MSERCHIAARIYSQYIDYLFASILIAFGIANLWNPWAAWTLFTLVQIGALYAAAQKELWTDASSNALKSDSLAGDGADGDGGDTFLGSDPSELPS